VGAVVLGAGAGSRFGEGPKLLALLDGRPLVAWALDAVVSAGLDRAAVVTRPGDDALEALVPAGVTVVPNARWAGGMATSLAAAVAWARAADLAAVVVGLGDQPRVRPDAWRAVAAAGGTPIAMAAYAGGRRGHPVRLHRDVWPLLPESGDAGARVVIRERPDWVTLVPCPGGDDDVDTVADLERLAGGS
jgi:CTP:molybdopterin cytidylyltransferase MocA